jgi:glycosyltransferase involved in cell wall biosynthesis
MDIPFDKNVLVIAYYFPPMGLSGVQRTLKFVKYLPQYGWHPLVLTSNPTSYYAFDDSLTAEMESLDLQVFRTVSGKIKTKEQNIRKTSKFPRFLVQKLGSTFLQTFYQPDRFIGWKKKAVALGEEIIRNNDIGCILATAPPYTGLMVANELSKRTGIPFIADYRDPWVDNPYHFYATPFHKTYSIKLETDVLIHAKKIIVTTRHTKELILKRYKFISHDDITIVPHGFDPTDFEELGNIRTNSTKFTITHSGVFQDNRTPAYFLKALSRFLKKNPAAAANIEARFVGVMRPEHLKLIKKYNLLENTRCTGYLPHMDAVRNLMESDALWLMQNDNVRSPGKLYEYFGAAKPMLICVPDGIIRRTALESKVAIATDPKDVNAIEAAIESLYKMWKSRTLPTPRPDFIEQYNRKLLTASLAKELSTASEI